MRNLKRKLVFAGALAFIMATGVSALSETVQFCGCRCPLVYAPVVCDKGRTYPNPCVAACHNARNCVPTGGV